ncbi:hypothetical protein D3C79_1029130 [compost metagenome]
MPTMSRIANGPSGAPVPIIHVLSIVSGSATSFTSKDSAASKNGTSNEFKI